MFATRLKCVSLWVESDFLPKLLPRSRLSGPPLNLRKVEDSVEHFYGNRLEVCGSQRGLKVVMRGNSSKGQILMEDMK